MVTKCITSKFLNQKALLMRKTIKYVYTCFNKIIFIFIMKTKFLFLKIKKN